MKSIISIAQEFLARRKWIREGKPIVFYRGYHCGLCGCWVESPFAKPQYKSAGKWWDTWGICEKCSKGK